MPDTPKVNPKPWGRGKPRIGHETLRSFSAPHAVQSSPAPVRARTPARSLSATEQPVYRHEPEATQLEDKYDFAYCDVTSPSEEESEKGDAKMSEEGSEILEPGSVSVGPPRRVVAALLPGSGLQRAQLRPAVKSFNTRVRDLASVLPAPRQYTPRGAAPSPAPTPAAGNSARSRAPPSSWMDDDFKSKIIIIRIPLPGGMKLVSSFPLGTYKQLGKHCYCMLLLF